MYYALEWIFIGAQLGGTTGLSSDKQFTIHKKKIIDNSNNLKKRDLTFIRDGIAPLTNSVV